MEGGLQGEELDEVLPGPPGGAEAQLGGAAMRTLGRIEGEIQGLAAKASHLRGKIFSLLRSREEKRGLFGTRGVVTMQPKVKGALRRHQPWMAAQLETSKGYFLVNGVSPRVVVVDSGATTPMISMAFFIKLGMAVGPKYWEKYITASGALITSPGTTVPLQYTFGPGTTHEMTYVVKAILAETNGYDVLIGSELIDPIELFVYRADWEGEGLNLGYLPTKCRHGNSGTRGHGDMGTRGHALSTPGETRHVWLIIRG